MVLTAKAASRWQNALRCRPSRASAPPNIRTSTIVCTEPESGPAAASSTSTVSAVSSRNSVWCSKIGIGSTGSAWTAPIAA
ncbi:Uncharacterised protein [Mycolicibacterium fortuitum]|uniref:Uncharacterized protein n=1 Tax=Mycolicibacterium fortuitum TaxID=1766 RepID=A0A378U6A4_MYCFO|nr:Uncharacterised protein [Mycolicibacterium fortuitum]